jgi:hypothetical protein
MTAVGFDRDRAIYLKDATGKTFEHGGRRVIALRRAVLNGAGQPLVVQLIESGYTEFLADDGQLYDLTELAEFIQNRKVWSARCSSDRRTRR